MDKVTVTQADRDWAADMLDIISGLGTGHLSDAIREARRDDHEFVRTLVDHRIEATRQAEEKIKLLREALADAMLCAMSSDVSKTEIAKNIAEALEATNG